MTDGLVVELSPAEAMTIVAALRQYEPYWSPRSSPAAVAEQLAAVHEHITSVVAKVRLAAG